MHVGHAVGSFEGPDLGRFQEHQAALQTRNDARRRGHERAFVPIFFFKDSPTTEIYTLSLHDALPISVAFTTLSFTRLTVPAARTCLSCCTHQDRKSTRLNSSHDQISYAVFCLKKKKKKTLISFFKIKKKKKIKNY